MGRRSELPEAGLQRQRTVLAWNRTALALLATAALLVRAGLVAGNRPLAVAGWVLVVATGGLWALGRRRHAADRAGVREGRGSGSRAHLALVAGFTAATGLSVLVAVVLSGNADG